MALTGYIGDFGDGKTANMTADTHKAAYKKDALGREKKVRAVYSNLTLIDYRVRWNPWHVESIGGQLVRGRWEPLNADTFGRSWADGRITHWEQLLGVHNAIVMIDEIEAIFGNVDWGKMPKEVFARICMQRKQGLDFVWSSPMNSLVNNRIRNLTTCCWHCVKVPKTKLVSLTKIDMRNAKNKTVRRLVTLNNDMFDLYDSWEIMGDLDKVGSNVGQSIMREGLRPEQRAVLIRMATERGECHPFLNREVPGPGANRWHEWGVPRLFAPPESVPVT